MPIRSPRPPQMLGLAASALVLMLAGCSGRDTDMAEKLARAEAAAKRAEAAAERAEGAVKRIPASRPAEPSTREDSGQAEPAFGEPTSEGEPTA